MQNGKHWVGSWAAAPAPAEGVVGFNNHTLRMMPRLSLGGDTLRVRISNAYGARPLVIGAARIGLRDKGPGIVPGSNKTLTFGGSDSGVIAAGSLIVSDPVQLNAPPLADLAVSLYLPSEVLANFQITGRYARQTNYISPAGNFADATVMLGTNDLRNRWAKPEEEVTGEQMIAGLQQMAVRAHGAGIKIIGATLTPFGNETFMANAWNPTRERHRVTVNEWIRESGAFDAVADFDRAIRDPECPTQMLGIYDCGDGLHPSDLGYCKLGDAIDLAWFE